ncbi:hypothetical protein KSD_02350 [Ktedonobacter sp. SOSP1-85]|nr:hypothetical protein KSD_02350 [Ktedonobacter sp. SOSP1-85]
MVVALGECCAYFVFCVYEIVRENGAVNVDEERSERLQFQRNGYFRIDGEGTSGRDRPPLVPSPSMPHILSALPMLILRRRPENHVFRVFHPELSTVAHWLTF